MHFPDVQTHESKISIERDHKFSPREGSKARIFVWSPTDPNQLFHFPLDVKAAVGCEVGRPTESLKFEAALADGGDCNQFEQKALTRILDVYSRYYSDETDGEKFAKIQNLAEQYVLLVQECVDEWISSRQQRHQAWADEASSRAATVNIDDVMMDDAEKEDDFDDEENLMMLKWAFGVVALSSVYLRFLSPYSPLNREVTSHVVGMQPHPLDNPGLASSDLVRFLREVYPYMKEQDLEQAPISSKPLQLCQSKDSLMEDSDRFASEPQFDWEGIRTLVVSGLLVQAWQILIRHPKYRAAKHFLYVSGDDTADTDRLRHNIEVVYEFETVGVLLLFAPLPGSPPVANDDAIDDMIKTFSGDASSLVSDLHSSDCEGWDKEYDGYSHQEAARNHQRWQQIVMEALRRRKSACGLVVIPEIDDLLRILSGDFSGVRFESWGEELCATILYQKPYTTPMQVAQCAEDMILRRGDTLMSTSDRVPPFVANALVSLMHGNVEDAIGFLSTIGNSSVAALPSTITALLYAMCLEAGVAGSHGEISDMLRHASMSILSTIEPEHSTYLVIQLLRPFALRDGGDEIIGTIASILELHDSDDTLLAARIIEICRPLIQRQAADVLDGCCSLILSCYRSLTGFAQLADGVHWLQKGVELESTVLAAEIRAEGSCYRTLAVLCYRAAKELADEFLEGNDTRHQGPTSRALDRAKHILEGLENSGDAGIASTLPARTLRSLFICCGGVASIKERADQLITCFQTTMRIGEFTLRSFVPQGLHWTLLQVARKLIFKAAEASSSDNANPLCVFDAAGITLLMDTLNQHRLLERTRPHLRRFSDDEIKEMERAMSLALKCALVAKPVDAYGSGSPVSLTPKEGSYLNFLSQANVARVAAVSSMFDD